MKKEKKIKEPNVIKSKTLFDHLNNITAVQDKDYWNALSVEDKKTWSNYMVIRFLSMNPSWTELLSQLQPVMQTLEPEVLYKFLINIIPKGRVFSKYVKAQTEIIYPNWLIDLVCKDFMCSSYTAVDYLNILYSTKEGRESVIYLCKKYGTNPKDIEKLKLDD